MVGGFLGIVVGEARWYLLFLVGVDIAMYWLIARFITSIFLPIFVAPSSHHFICVAGCCHICMLGGMVGGIICWPSIM